MGVDGVREVSRDERGGGRPYGLALLASGGVDSAVALAVLAEAGLNPFAVTMALPRFSGRSETGGALYECDSAPILAAVRLCRTLGVSHAVLDMSAAFRRLVIDPFVDAYGAGRTPNPCVRCNPDVKFGLARRWSERELGVRVVASGHYAGLVESGGGTRLARAHGDGKDQSYFLYRLPPADLADTRFPLAAFAGKEAVRAEARRRGLAGAEAGDSMDVCFLSGGDYRPLVAARADPGLILDPEGRVLGRHGGSRNFTVGQRRGFGAGFGRPMYVLRIDPARNVVVVGPREMAFRRDVAARDPVIHDPGALRPGARVLAKIRSGGEPRPAEVVCGDAGCLAVRFEDGVYAPAHGQHLVLYDAAGLVLAGGEITPDFLENS